MFTLLLKNNIGKIIIMVLVRAVEITVLYFLSLWIWSKMPEPYRMITIVLLAVAYAAYFIVALINDYKYIYNNYDEPVV
ncbi:hypothetical protein JW911_01250 [Candidatus Peregrinibacteria bacterium]|nr:hypothetical protein [Candidatus Peregrinibacteria bacterium]